MPVPYSARAEDPRNYRGDGCEAHCVSCGAETDLTLRGDDVFTCRNPWTCDVRERRPRPGRVPRIHAEARRSTRRRTAA